MSNGRPAGVTIGFTYVAVSAHSFAGVSSVLITSQRPIILLAYNYSNSSLLEISSPTSPQPSKMSLTTINFASCTFDSVTSDNVITFTLTAIGPLDSTIPFGDIVLVDSSDEFHFQCISTSTQNLGTSNDENNWTAKHSFQGKPTDGNPEPTLHVRISYHEGVVGREPQQAELTFDMREGGNGSEGFPNGSPL